MQKYILILCCTFILSGCTLFDSETTIGKRTDAAIQLNIVLDGSLQNPAWSPDSTRIVFTRFRDGYNEGVSDLFIYNTKTEVLTELLADGNHNITAPNNAWHRFSGRIVFTSDVSGKNELYLISPDSIDQNIVQLTDLGSQSASYGGFSGTTAGVSFVARDTVDGVAGRIMTIEANGEAPIYLAMSGLLENCDKPNWSSISNLVLFECVDGNQTDLWIRNSTGFASRNITSSSGKSETGAVWAKDGLSILYSDKNNSDIFAIEVSTGALTALTSYSGYSGRPALSPDSTTLVFESAISNAEGSGGTTLWVIEDIEY